MTKSQKIKLNEILHREPIGYVSTFECGAHSGFACDNTDITKPVEMIEQKQAEESIKQNEQKQNENNSCCIIS